MKNKIRYHFLIILLAALVLILLIAVVWIGNVNYTGAMVDERIRAISGAAQLAADQIDGDSIERWLSEGPDEEYEQTAERLNDILKTSPYVEYLEVIRIDRDGAVVIFDLIPPEETGEGTSEEPVYQLGEVIPQVKEDRETLERLQRGDRVTIDPIPNASLSAHYEPIADSKGIYRAHVRAGCDFDLITKNSRQISQRIILIALIFFGVFLLLLVRASSLFRRVKENEERGKEADRVARLFDQTATSLANAIDMKDKYTHGHSVRVAQYSRKIAEDAGKTPKECDEIYYAALLHDVGKIGIPDGILTKEGALTEEEYEEIKKHPGYGSRILSNINESPYLSIGAHYHHERFDGRGYPDHLKGTDIPEIARIIAVADAYDAMTSKRSYRDPIPQQKVREELVKGSGTQFDPEFAKIMLHLIDMDLEYKMKERVTNHAHGLTEELVIHDHRSEVTEGILLNAYPIDLSVHVRHDPEHAGNPCRPSLILFDALDSRIHTNPNEVRDLLYFEYAEIWFDGKYMISGARKVRSEKIGSGHGRKGEYVLNAFRIKDHVKVVIAGEKETYEMIVALPDSIRFAHLALTGEHCSFDDSTLERREEAETAAGIPRIAEEISFIEGPEGDIPNLQVDGYRTDATEGIDVGEGLKITFHTKSLPTARLVWHCPYINIFTSQDGKVNGTGYRDFMLARLDGECWEGAPQYTVHATEQKTDAFESWDQWKARNKEGYDCTIFIERTEKEVIVRTENFGISLRSSVLIPEGTETVYAALTGDQVALTEIRITQKETT